MSTTMGQMFRQARLRYGDRVAVRCRGESRSYEELIGNGARLANALRAHGLRPGEHVAAMLQDWPESLEVYIACFLGGFTAVHVNDRLQASEIAYVLEDSDARAFIHTAGRSDVVARVEGLDGMRVVVTIGDELVDGALSYRDLLAEGSNIPPAETTQPEDIAIIGYTSGTTGFPKGVMASHRAVLGCARLVPFAYRIPMYGRCAFTGTLAFVSAIWGVIFPHLYVGGTVTFLGEYTPESWVDVVEAERSTFTYTPTPLIRAFIAEVQRRPGAIDSLESVLHSASAAPRDDLEALGEIIGPRLTEVWGMTEVVAPLTSTFAEDFGPHGQADDIFASVGRPLANARMWVADDDGNPLPTGETGELLVEADTLFSGYYGRPDETAEVLRDGHYLTGDVGRMDAAGYVYVTDRKRDMIVSGGMNIYPKEIEHVLARLDGVADVAVIAAPHDRWGETVVAAIVRATGATLEEEDVIAFSRDHLASYKKPTRVVFVDALPRNASLKVVKHVLRDQLVDG